MGKSGVVVAPVRALSVFALLAVAGAAAGADWSNPAGGAWGNAANWTPMMVPGTPAVIALRGTYTVQVGPSQGFATAQFQMTNGNATVFIADNSSLTLASGAHTNNGAILINNFIGGSNNSVLHVDGTLDGSGAAVLADSNSDDAQLNGTFTQGVGHAIVGTGLVNAALTNNGLVSADVPGANLFLLGSNKANNAVMEAVGGGFLAIQNITVDQTGGGVINLDGPGSTLRFPPGTNSGVTGGSINAVNGGGHAVRENSATTTLTGVTLNADLDILDNATLIAGAGGVVNNGVISVNQEIGGSNNSVLHINDALNGTGTVLINDNNSDDAQVNGVFTQAPTHAIVGQGRLNAALTNNGLVSANLSGRTLVLGSANKVNNAVFEAVDGGILAVESVAIDQSGGGEINVDGATSQVRFIAGNNSSITGGTINAFNGAPPVLRDNSATTTLLGVTLNADFTIGDNANVVVGGGGIENNGLFRINNEIAGSNNSVLHIDGVLDGEGVVQLNDNNSDDAQLNGTFTQTATHTISGQGRLNATLTNDGLVSADLAGRTLVLSSGAKVNNAVFEAAAGGILAVESVTINQAGGGEINVDAADSFVRFLAGNNSTVIGGTINGEPGHEPVLRDHSAATTLTGVTLNADFIVGDNATVVANGGGLTNNNTLIVNNSFAGSNNSNLHIEGVLDGSGNVFLNDNNSDDAQVNGTFTQAAAHTIRGMGHLNAALTNEGTVSAHIPTGTLSLRATNKVNHAVMEARNGGILGIESITIDQTAAEGGGGQAGQLLADGPGSQVVFQPGNNSAVVNGSIEQANGAQRALRHHSANTTLTGVTLNSDFLIGDNASITVNPPFTNNRELSVNDFFAGSNNSVLAFAANTTIAGTGSIFLKDSNSDDAQLHTANSLINGVDHTLGGLGLVSGSFTNEGTLAPGLPAGTLAMTSGAYTQTATGIFQVTLSSNTSFSRLTLPGAASLAGGTTVIVTPGYAPPVGQEYIILTASSVTGTMPVVAATDIGGLKFATIVEPTQVKLVVGYCADLNNNGIVDSPDLNILLGGFGTTPAGDISGDGLTTSVDLNLLLAQFGQPCEN